MNREQAAAAVRSGNGILGIELGSTRIKAVLIDEAHEVIASGSFNWENRLENGLWTYRLEDAVFGLQESYRALSEAVLREYGEELTELRAIGISGMMHGYLALDSENRQLAPFLTWRNTHTSAAAAELTSLFDFNIPLRWSIAQLYQAILNNEEHVGKIAHITTLAGYIHLLLSGEKAVSVGEASGIFPVDTASCDYDAEMLSKFSSLIADRNYPWNIRDILPKSLPAGECAGTLSEEGAKLLDPKGKLKARIPMAPPEGDAGTGMVATNSVSVCTGNVSAGTSAFSMVVMEKPLSRLYTDIDIVTTPTGKPVAMVHCNNCASELDAWIRLFKETVNILGHEVSDGDIYEKLFKESLKGDGDCDGVILFNYLSGEPVTGLKEGCPLLLRRPDSRFNMANFMRSQIYAAFASLAIGMRILTDEKVEIKRLTGHGGLFKTPGVAQSYLASFINVPITVTKTAGEGGPFGAALLAAYLVNKKQGETLEEYLEDRVFSRGDSSTIEPEPRLTEAVSKYLEQYEKALKAEACAAETVLR